MDINAVNLNDVIRVDISGKLDTETSTDAYKSLGEIITGQRKKILINFAKLDYISSAGLRVILAITKELEKDNGRLYICNVNEVVKEIFEITGFNFIFKIFPSEEEALKALES